MLTKEIGQHMNDAANMAMFEWKFNMKAQLRKLLGRSIADDELFQLTDALVDTVFDTSEMEHEGDEGFIKMDEKTAKEIRDKIRDCIEIT
jgi:hypothetical protein